MGCDEQVEDNNRDKVIIASNSLYHILDYQVFSLKSSTYLYTLH